MTSSIDYAEMEELLRNVEEENDLFTELMTPQKSAKQVNKKRKRAPISDAAKAVIREFEDALVADGFVVGALRDGTAMKYCGYMHMLFEHGVFSSRADFFDIGARAHAHQFYRSFAEQKVAENGGKTSAKKLYRNFSNGFDKFVLLCGTAMP